MAAGEWAVAGCFVLSGCVLVRRYVEHSNDINISISSLIRRFPRLLIPSTIALIFYFVRLHFRTFDASSDAVDTGQKIIFSRKLNTKILQIWKMQLKDVCG